MIEPTFTIDAYEAANLLWLLQELTDDPEWRIAFNTGDWLWQLRYRLEVGPVDHRFAVAAAGDARRRTAAEE